MRIGANQILLPPEGKTFFPRAITSKSSPTRIVLTSSLIKDAPTKKKCKYIIWALAVSYEQGSKDAMKGFNYDPPSLLKICDLLCVAIGGLM